jgi:hypothetical protein
MNQGLGSTSAHGKRELEKRNKLTVVDSLEYCIFEFLEHNDTIVGSTFV